ncbi:RNA polymerase sigma factor SigM [uncultured Pseudokineococcus sp.]|uniref:RNA polymerase sigma factor SigM n=1 Tax=uncultured Pseudokineococcus sp. TaxID=1642928 RepID=UPI00261B9530|nr:RNA polymerase sigma factor SigM [uncultured Pseudokineococcus sp.]
MSAEPRSPGPREDPRDDAELLRAHLAGDGDAFGEVVRRHAPRLWAVALGVLGDREEAADAVQDALVSALRAAGSFRGDAAVTTWLHRIVVNASLDRLRRARVRRTVPLDAEGPGSGAAGPAVERLAARGDAHAAVDLEVDVGAALAELPEHQRAALVLVDLQDLPVAEAAAVLGVAVGTVKSRCARGRAALAVLLRARGLDPRRGSGPSPAPAAPDLAGNRTGARDVREVGTATGAPHRRPPAAPHVDPAARAHPEEVP